ncbi:hypothetical protein D1007_45961 [Hordeum vulgare]|nr:hypothetical protein D1007_45961 [Hordeum vulgare]
MSTTLQTHGFRRHHPQTSRLSNSTGSGTPEVSVVEPAMPAPAGIDLNTMLVGGGSSSRGVRKRTRELPTGAMGNVCNPFDKMTTAKGEVNYVFMESLIYEGGDGGIPFNPD